MSRRELREERLPSSLVPTVLHDVFTAVAAKPPSARPEDSNASDGAAPEPQRDTRLFTALARCFDKAMDMVRGMSNSGSQRRKISSASSSTDPINADVIDKFFRNMSEPASMDFPRAASHDSSSSLLRKAFRSTLSGEEAGAGCDADCQSTDLVVLPGKPLQDWKSALETLEQHLESWAGPTRSVEDPMDATSLNPADESWASPTRSSKHHMDAKRLNPVDFASASTTASKITCSKVYPSESFSGIIHASPSAGSATRTSFSSTSKTLSSRFRGLLRQPLYDGA